LRPCGEAMKAWDVIVILSQQSKFVKTFKVDRAVTMLMTPWNALLRRLAYEQEIAVSVKRYVAMTLCQSFLLRTSRCNMATNKSGFGKAGKSGCTIE
jgi:hypothetical protein